MEDPNFVYRDFNTQGNPGSGDYEPEKARIRALLNEMMTAATAASAGLVRTSSLPELEDITGTRVGQPGQVLLGPDAGEYWWTGDEWEFLRELDDAATAQATADQAILDAATAQYTANLASTAVLSVSSGTNNLTVTAASGSLDAVDFILVPTNTNTGAMTINGTAFNKPNGEAMQAGDIASGVPVYLSKVSGEYRLLSWPRDLDGPVRMIVSGGTADAITATISSGPADARNFTTIPALANTGPVTINGIELRRPDGSNLIAGDLMAGVPILFTVYATRYRLLFWPVWNDRARIAALEDKDVAQDGVTAKVLRKFDSPFAMNRDIIDDTDNRLGGGSAVYVPRSGTFRNASTGATFTMSLSADSKMADWHKVAVPQTTQLTVLYYDTVDLAVKVAIVGTTDNMPVDVDRYFHLVSIWGPSVGGGAGYASRYNVVSTTNKNSSVASLASGLPLPFDRVTRKLLIPDVYGYRTGTATWNLAPPTGASHRELVLPSSNTIYHVYIDTNDIAVNGSQSATAVVVVEGYASTPRVNNNGEAGLILLGMGWNRTFVAAEGFELAEIVRNQCGFGRQDIALAENVTNGQLADVIETPLTALGFTKAWQSSLPSDKSFYYGGKFDEPTGAGTIFYRVFFETDVDNDFGTVKARLATLSSAGVAGYIDRTMTLFKSHSPRVREYFELATAASPTGAFTGVEVGSESGTTNVRATGLQYAAVPDNMPWIGPTDYPRASAVIGYRLRSLENAASSPGLPLDPIIPADLYMIDERRYPIYLDQMVRNPVDGRLRATVANVPATNVEILETDELQGGTITLGGDDGEVARIILHDRGGSSVVNYRRDVTMHVAPMADVASLSFSILAIGDSLTAATGLFVNAVRRMQDMGATVTALGTRNMVSKFDGAGGRPNDGTLLGEGRSGMEFANFIYQKTTPMLVPASVGAYNAASNAAKENLNPFIRPTAGGDDPDMVFNGYIFDFEYYRTTYLAGVRPDVVWVFLGMNDMNPGRNDAATAIEHVENGLNVIINQVRADCPDALIVVPFPCYGRTADNARWSGHIWDGLEVFTKFVRDLGDDNLILVPLYSTMSRDTGYTMTSFTDTDTGMIVDTVDDATHPGLDGVRQAGEVLAQATAAKLIEG